MVARNKSIYKANRPFLKSVAAIIVYDYTHAALVVWSKNVLSPFKATWEGTDRFAGQILWEDEEMAMHTIMK